MVNIMKIARIIVICVFISTCLASEEIDSNRQKHVVNKLLYHDQVGNTPRDITHKRDERSHPNKMTHESKAPPKGRPINLRLDTVPRKLVNTIPTVIKPVINVPMILGRAITPHIKREHLRTNDISRISPNITVKSQENSRKIDENAAHIEKPIVKQFFEDNDEPLPIVHPKIKESNIPKGDIKAEKKDILIQPKFIETDDDDDDLNNAQIVAKIEPSPHIDEKLKLNVTKNKIKEIPGHPHKDTERVVSVLTIPVGEIEKPIESRTANVSDIEEITLVRVGCNKNQTKNENQMSIKVKLGEPPIKSEYSKIEPNDTSVIISNRDFEELRERSTSYTTETADIRSEEPFSDITYWNYNVCPYYNPYEQCNYNDPSTYRFEYNNYKMPYEYYNNNVYTPTDTSNYQVLDVKPDNTDRIYRSWKNTEVRINKGKNPINVDVEKFYRNNGVIKMPYCYEHRPVIGNGYYSNQNMACPFMYPSYRYEP